MPNHSTKLKAFEFLTECLIKWHKEVNPQANISTSFNKLKLIKLHFFASAVGANNQNNGLLDIFDNFFALPFGHVESEIYDSLNELQSFKLDRSSLIMVQDFDHEYFNEIETYKVQIIESVSSLRNINNDIVSYDAMKLVDLSHQWYSWKATFEAARSLGKFSMHIPVELIKKESKTFFLN